MKQFFLWLGILVLVYTGLSAGAYFTASAHAKKILIAVDVSASLEDVKDRLPEALAGATAAPYAEFEIVTNSPNNSHRLIQSWSAALNWEAVEKIKMYETLDPAALLDFADVKTADEIVFVTNAANVSALQNVPRSIIVRVK
jgi:hypothetical protein